jgi:hypothetical protein
MVLHGLGEFGYPRGYVDDLVLGEDIGRAVVNGLPGFV